MFSHRPVFLHQVNLSAPMLALNLEMAEDFAVVSGLSSNAYAASPFVYPTCDAAEAAYLIPCGAAGLPYIADLGRPGGSVGAMFPSLVTAVTVATYSALRPAVQVSTLVVIAGNVGLIADDDAGLVYTRGRIQLSDNGAPYSVKSAMPRPADDFFNAFPAGSRWKGENGYPGFTLIRD